jgi:hypothetical protein
MVRPNLFLLGLPKCGTSSIANVLAMHPAILGSVPKETFFIVDADSPFYRNDSYHAIGNKGWSRFFMGTGASSDIRYFMDATTHLAFQKSAPEVLRTYEQCALLIVLRDPAERIYSSFNYTKYNLGFIDSDISFSRYVDDLLTENLSMDYIYNSSSRYVLSHELAYSDYLEVLKPWQSFYNENRLYIALFEDMRDNHHEFYSRIFRWLNLPVIDHSNKARNRTYRPKNLGLHRFLFMVNRLFRNVPGVNYLKQFYFKRFTAKNSRTIEDLKALDQLKAYYNKKNKALAELYRLDTSKWN